MRSSTVFVSSVLLLSAGAARADEAGEPAFVRLGPDAPGGALDVTFLATEGDDWIERLNARVEMLAATGFGGYAEVAADHHESGSGLGGLDVGLLFRRQSGPSSAIAGRVGLVLPTISDESGELLETLVADPSDVARGFDATTLRLAVTPSWRGGAVFRLDAGLDVPISDDDRGLDAFVHVDAGVAFGSGALGGALELQVLVPVVGEGDSETFVTATGTLQYRTPQGTPFLGLSTSLESEVREDFPFTLVLGGRVPL